MHDPPTNPLSPEGRGATPLPQGGLLAARPRIAGQEALYLLSCPSCGAWQRLRPGQIEGRELIECPSCPYSARRDLFAELCQPQGPTALRTSRRRPQR